MRVAGANRYFLNPSEEETLAKMATDHPRSEVTSAAAAAAAAEEGFEVSHGDSAEGPRSRVWMGYTMPRNYAAHLYNFAWAQAVQNKPLGLDLNPVGSEADPDSEGLDMVIDVSSEESGGGMEKEEGELEEGEIELGSEPAAEQPIELDSDKPEEKKEPEEKESDGIEHERPADFDSRVSLILEELDGITMEEAEASFEGACSRLHKSFESLKPLFSEMEEGPLPVMDSLVQWAFTGIQTVNSVLSSSHLPKKEENKNLFLRLLIRLKNQYSTLLTPEQINELDKIVKSLAFEEGKTVKELSTADGGIADALSSGAEKPTSAQRGVNSLTADGPSVSLPRLELPTMSRNKAISPLLDLHADYDESSLPSPTRANSNSPPFPMPKPVGVGSNSGLSTKSTSRPKMDEDTALHSYVTDAVKAVSTYQQKYGKNSFLTTNRLPSPTPSDDSNNDNEQDTCNGEVSSSSAALKARQVNTTRNGSIKPVGQVGPGGPGPNSGLKAAAKSRDPRLRFMKSEAEDGISGMVMNSRKNKAVDESLPEEHSSKRLRNGVNDRVQLREQSKFDNGREEMWR
ncbi:RNA polymerase II C-terminal domain phosphatase-like 3 [Ananas comosus]|uniref:RNA polymerase II C-terminal domain phosphatase-like 3 n=1 Tax=Ananas comosus TaxID=4615 RepID=A0A199V118_ANACO|nr:RNA polymerase II C-terminal domain phosphatase-like 3 [Ananas comosus]